ncbi:MAG: ribosomal-processing cysteine protease Prp [Waltera sp.]
MTTIIIRKDHEGIYRGFYCMGHAGYAKKRLFGTEPDILCAAISVLVQSTIDRFHNWQVKNSADPE